MLQTQVKIDHILPEMGPIQEMGRSNIVSERICSLDNADAG